MENPSIFSWIAIGIAVLIIIYLIYDSKKVNEILIKKSKELEDLQRNSKLSSESYPEKLVASSKKDESIDVSESLKFEELKDAEARLQKDLADSRDELKRTKQALYDVKQDNQRLKDKKKEADAKPKVADSDVVFALRQEIANLKGTIESLKDEAADLNEQIPGPQEEKETNMRKKHVTSQFLPNDDDKKREEKNQHIEALKKLEEEHRKTEGHLRNEIKSLQTEINELRARAKDSSLAAAREKRRADNNDKAYKITQRQLDATNERITHYERLMRQATIALEKFERQRNASQPTQDSQSVSKTHPEQVLDNIDDSDMSKDNLPPESKLDNPSSKNESPSPAPQDSSSTDSTGSVLDDWDDLPKETESNNDSNDQ